MTSTSIFSYLQTTSPVQKCQRTTKAQKFRLEIRKKQQEQKFMSIRKQFVQSLRSLNFLQELKSQRDNLTAKKINWIISGLETGKNNASFYQQIIDMRLEPCLCQLILQDITLQNKTKIINSLVELTYFSCIFPREFIQSNIIDQLRLMLTKLSISVQIQQEFIYQAANLIYNLTTFQNQEFNNHMMESDFLPVLQVLVNQPTNSAEGYENSLLIREILLKIYCNLARTTNKNSQYTYIYKLLFLILKDQNNYNTTNCRKSTLEYLVQIAKIKNFWLELSKKFVIEYGNVIFCILVIVEDIDREFCGESFGVLVEFMLALYQQYQRQINQQVYSYILQFPPTFFYRSLQTLQKSEHLPRTKKTICKTIKLLSFIKHIQIDNVSVYQNKIQKDQFITLILARYIATHVLYGKYLIRVLCKILDEEHTTIDVLIDNGIVDIIVDVFQSQFFKEEKIDIIILVEKLIEIQEELRTKQQTSVTSANKNNNSSQNKMLHIFYNRGIIKSIEQLQNQTCIEVFKCSQKFMNRISEISDSERR